MRALKKLLPLLLATLYFLLVHLLMQIRPEHLLLVGLLLVGYYLHRTSRRLVLVLFPFVLFAALYDFLRIYPKEWAGPIHVVWPYQIEKLLFGFPYRGERIIPCDFFRIHHFPFLDILTGVAYSLHVIVPLGFTLYAWVKNRGLAHQFAWALFVANLFSFITYVALPVAPPWYVEEYGLIPADWSIPASVAGLEHFDRIIGLPYFQKLYAKSAWVFGAIPSMHAGFPLLTILFARKILKKGTIPLYFFMGLVWFSAIYLRHHYIIDLLAGALYVTVVYHLIRRNRE